MIYRLTPDESTSTDPRPNVGDTATAYYLLATGAGDSQAAADVQVDGTALVGQTVANGSATITWAAATTLAAASAATVAASLF